jgi:hypothetical protein
MWRLTVKKSIGAQYTWYRCLCFVFDRRMVAIAKRFFTAEETQALEQVMSCQVISFLTFGCVNVCIRVEMKFCACMYACMYVYASTNVS